MFYFSSAPSLWFYYIKSGFIRQDHAGENGDLGTSALGPGQEAADATPVVPVVVVRGIDVRTRILVQVVRVASIGRAGGSRPPVAVRTCVVHVPVSVPVAGINGTAGRTLEPRTSQRSILYLCVARKPRTLFYFL